MKEKPIIFSIEMVRAILEGRKTQARRKIRGGYMHHYDFYTYTDVNGKHRKIPYICGDILWVRETWARLNSCLYCGCDNEPALQDGCYLYLATHGEVSNSTIKWRPSIHMPRVAARIFLRVTGVRVERLQDINHNDIQAEGFIPECQGHFKFKWVWDDLNEKNGYGWNANPWVWVYEFERVEGAKII